MDKRKLTLGIVGALLLIIVATVGFFATRTNADVPPEKVLEHGLTVLFRGNARNVKAELKIYSPGKEKKDDFLADVIAQGVLERSGDNKIGFDGAVDLKNQRAGLGLNYSFLLRNLNEGTYLNVKEMPGTKEIKNLLFDKWLILRSGEQPAIPFAAIENLVTLAKEQKIIADVVKLGPSDVAGVKSEKYLIKIDQDLLRQIAEKESKNDRNSAVEKAVLGRTALILNNFNIREAYAWFDNADHGINRLSIVLSPKKEKLQSSSVSFDVELSSVAGEPPTIEAPQNPQAFSQGGLLWQLVSLGFR